MNLGPTAEILGSHRKRWSLDIESSGVNYAGSPGEYPRGASFSYFPERNGVKMKLAPVFN